MKNKNNRVFSDVDFSLTRVGSPRFILSGRKIIFRNKNRIFSFIHSRDMIYVRSIKHKERVYNKFGWVLKIDIEKSWDFGFFAKNHRFSMFFVKNHTSVSEVLGPPRDLTASPMSIFKTHPDLLQTRSLCLILRTYTISRGCMKPKIVFSIRKIFFEEVLDRGGAREYRQKSSFWLDWPARGLVVPMFRICRMDSPRFTLPDQKYCSNQKSNF